MTGPSSGDHKCPACIPVLGSKQLFPRCKTSQTLLWGAKKNSENGFLISSDPEGQRGRLKTGGVARERPLWLKLLQCKYSLEFVSPEPLKC